MTSPQQNSGGPEYMGSPAAGALHQRRKWDRPSHGHDPPGQVWPPAPPGRRLCCAGDAAPRNCCLMTGQGNERGVPNALGRRQTNELATLNWRPCSHSRGATTPAVAMSSMRWNTVALPPVTSGRVVAELHEVFDFCRLERPSSTSRTAPTNCKTTCPIVEQGGRAAPWRCRFSAFPHWTTGRQSALFLFREGRTKWPLKTTREGIHLPD